jgi:hypothetical protein
MASGNDNIIAKRCSGLNLINELAQLLDFLRSRSTTVFDNPNPTDIRWA